MATTDERPALQSVSDMARKKNDADESDLPGGMVDGGDEGDKEEDDGTPQLVIPGTGPKLSGSVGGRKPTESFFKMRAVSLPIAGGVQMEKDSELWIAVPVAIDDVRVNNRRKNHEIAAVVRTHTAIPIGQPVILDGAPNEID
jgi:hypothetical protein